MRRIDEAILTGLHEAGLSASEASRALGLADDFLDDYLRRGVPRVLPNDLRVEIARLLGMPGVALLPPKPYTAPFDAAEEEDEDELV